MILYYSAADIHVYPSDNPLFIRFVGISNANIESLACNLPIYTSQIGNFLGDKNEQEKVGVDSGLCDDNYKMINDIANMYNNKEKYQDCRNIASKYYDRNSNASKIKEIYMLVNSNYQ